MHLPACERGWGTGRSRMAEHLGGFMLLRGGGQGVSSGAGSLWQVSFLTLFIQMAVRSRIHGPVSEGHRRLMRRLLLWSVLPTVAYMGYLMLTDGELYLPSRRSSGGYTVSWEQEPIRFMLGGLVVYGTFVGVLVMGWIFGGLMKAVIGALWHALYRRWIRWAQWKPWRKWWR